MYVILVGWTFFFLSCFSEFLLLASRSEQDVSRQRGIDRHNAHSLFYKHTHTILFDCFINR